MDTTIVIKGKKPLTIKDLYPGLSDEQLAEVKETLDNYFKIAWRISERMEHKKESKSKELSSSKSPEDKKK